MGAFINNTVTQAGVAAIAKALAGETITFTKIVLGDGALPPNTDPATLEAVINPTATVDIVKKEVVDQRTAIIGGIYTNNETSNGFYWRELALFADDPDVGEILYSYGNSGDFAEYIPPSGGQTVIEKSIDILTAVGDASKIIVSINADAYATVAQYESYKELALAAKASADDAIDISNEALEFARKALETLSNIRALIEELRGKTQTVWDALFTEITTNPFLVTFTDLDGIELTSGTWNKEAARMEC